MEGVLIHSLSEMNVFAEKFANGLEPHAGVATVVALRGDLGSGKTTFVQSLARSFGVMDHITSPTFVLQKKYPLTGQKFSTLVHMDAYRFERPDELQKLGWDVLLTDPTNLICLEWPERVAPYIPEGTVMLAFEHVDDATRRITRQS